MKAEEDRDKKLLEIEQEYSAAFESVSGKKVLEDMRKSFGDRLSYQKGDPYETAFREGQRDVYLRILYLMELATGKINREEE